MAFGDCPDDHALQSAWENFCTQLSQAGHQVFKNENPANPLQRADAFRFLTQNLGQAFDLALETKDPRYPVLHSFCGPSRKLGGDAADFTYQQAWISGDYSYRITGTLGSARFFNITVQGARPALQPGTQIPSLHEPFGDIPEANVFGEQIVTEADGSFEFFIGGPKRNNNWLPTTEHSRKLFIRQGFDDWQETPTLMTIECLESPLPKPLPGPTEMQNALAWAGDFITGVMNDWPEHPYQYSPFVQPAKVNCFPPDPASQTSSDDQKRGRAVAHLCWQLQPDQALIIEFPNHENFWMASLNGVFFNSFDYCYRSVSFTPARTHVNRDGKIRLVLCAQDPGAYNWLDSQGFTAGNLTYRNLRCNHNTPLTTQTVTLENLAEVLPADTRWVSAEERQAQLYQRFVSVSQRRLL